MSALKCPAISPGAVAFGILAAPTFGTSPSTRQTRQTPRYASRCSCAARVPRVALPGRTRLLRCQDGGGGDTHSTRRCAGRVELRAGQVGGGAAPTRCCCTTACARPTPARSPPAASSCCASVLCSRATLVCDRVCVCRSSDGLSALARLSPIAVFRRAVGSPWARCRVRVGRLLA